MENIEPEYKILKESVILAPTAKSHLELLKFSLTQAIEGEEESLINRFLESYFREYGRLLRRELDPNDPAVYEFSFSREDLIDFRKNTEELIKLLDENNGKKPMSTYLEYSGELKKIIFEIDRNLEKLDGNNEGNGERKAA